MSLSTNNSIGRKAQQLAAFIAEHPRLAVLSGAGCSTASGIPDYRDESGDWKHSRPVQYGDFVSSERVRRRYWARSYAGWSRIHAARPNRAHHALARLEQHGHVHKLITQNVDDLHRRAGSENIVDLHGVLHTVRCLDCAATSSRADLQQLLEHLNAGWAAEISGIRPDGDAEIAVDTSDEFRVPGCGRCGGMLKPDVVFFGENVPRERVQRCTDAVNDADALLVVGSSLMVFSGFRFARQANESGKPITIVNRGRTRADEIAAQRYDSDCGELLETAVRHLAG